MVSKKKDRVRDRAISATSGTTWVGEYCSDRLDEFSTSDAGPILSGTYDFGFAQMLVQTPHRSLIFFPRFCSSAKTRDDAASQFEELASEWSADTAVQSSIDAKIRHPAYQRIIGMGERALPLILTRLAKEPDHWFWALTSITGESPVAPDDYGNVKEMTRAWIEWGMRRAYIS